MTYYVFSGTLNPTHFTLLQSIAGMPLGETDANNMLDWEKLNAAEHLRKIKVAEQEKLDNRVVAIGDRCVQSGRNLYISDLVRNIGLLQKHSTASILV